MPGSPANIPSSNASDYHNAVSSSPSISLKERLESPLASTCTTPKSMRSRNGTSSISQLISSYENKSTEEDILFGEEAASKFKAQALSPLAAQQSCPPQVQRQSQSRRLESTSSLPVNNQIQTDPLTKLSHLYGGSKRNGLLKWAQERTKGYKHVEITNFSSSWSDGLALCALLHTYLPNNIPWKKLGPSNRKNNLQVAFNAASKIEIDADLILQDVLNTERPDWTKVMNYVAGIYKFFEN